jgi:hypothetical protein
MSAVAITSGATLDRLLRLHHAVAAEPHRAADQLREALDVSGQVSDAAGDYIRVDARIMSDALLALSCRSLNITEVYAFLAAARAMQPLVEGSLYRASRAAAVRA